VAAGRAFSRSSATSAATPQSSSVRHAMRNALLPAVTIIGLEFAFLIGGLVVTEQVFNLNGIGRLFVEAISRNDFILIQALVMLLAAVFVTMNLLVDLLYGVLDPRVRHT
jgi:peptide/nickel transport system permease protein